MEPVAFRGECGFIALPSHARAAPSTHGSSSGGEMPLVCGSVSHKSLKEILSTVVPLASSCPPAMHPYWAFDVI